MLDGESLDRAYYLPYEAFVDLRIMFGAVEGLLEEGEEHGNYYSGFNGFSEYHEEYWKLLIKFKSLDLYRLSMEGRPPWALKVKKGYKRNTTKELRVMTGHVPGTAKRSGILAMLESQWEYSSRVYKEEYHKEVERDHQSQKSTTFDNGASNKGK